jgi:hypothetical protein
MTPEIVRQTTSRKKHAVNYSRLSPAAEGLGEVATLLGCFAFLKRSLMFCSFVHSYNHSLQRTRGWFGKTSLALLLFAFFVSASSSLHAAVISLDFNTTGDGTPTGDVGVFPGQNGAWNSLELGANVVNTNKFTAPSILNMLDGDGNSTTVDFYLNTASAASSSPGSSGWRATDTSTTDLLRGDIAFVQVGQTSTQFFWGIEGLIPNGTYNLAFYGQRNTNNVSFVNAGLWTIGATALENYVSGSVTGEVVFLNVVADATGRIGGSFTQSPTDPSNYGAWSGLQIEAVPEPGRYALLCLGGMILWGARRKRV